MAISAQVRSPTTRSTLCAMRVRDAEITDASTIVEWNIAMARETEGKALDRATVERGVARLFAEPQRGRYFVAVDDDGAALGQLMITYEWSDWRDGDIFWIQSVYVAPAARRRGVYRALHEHVVAEARRAGAVGVRLYVEPHNERARRTYERLGMKKSYDVMELADPILPPRTSW